MVVVGGLDISSVMPTEEWRLLSHLRAPSSALGPYNSGALGLSDDVLIVFQHVADDVTYLWTKTAGRAGSGVTADCNPFSSLVAVSVLVTLKDRNSNARWVLRIIGGLGEVGEGWTGLDGWVLPLLCALSLCLLDSRRSKVGMYLLPKEYNPLISGPCEKDQLTDGENFQVYPLPTVFVPASPELCSPGPVLDLVLRAPSTRHKL